MIFRSLALSSSLLALLASGSVMAMEAPIDDAMDIEQTSPAPKMAKEEKSPENPTKKVQLDLNENENKQKEESFLTIESKVINLDLNDNESNQEKTTSLIVQKFATEQNPLGSFKLLPKELFSYFAQVAGPKATTMLGGSSKSLHTKCENDKETRTHFYTSAIQSVQEELLSDEKLDEKKYQIILLKYKNIFSDILNKTNTPEANYIMGLIHEALAQQPLKPGQSAWSPPTYNEEELSAAYKYYEKAADGGHFEALSKMLAALNSLDSIYNRETKNLKFKKYAQKFGTKGDEEYALSQLNPENDLNRPSTATILADIKRTPEERKKLIEKEEEKNKMSNLFDRSCSEKETEEERVASIMELVKFATEVSESALDETILYVVRSKSLTKMQKFNFLIGLSHTKTERVASLLNQFLIKDEFAWSDHFTNTYFDIIQNVADDGDKDAQKWMEMVMSSMKIGSEQNFPDTPEKRFNFFKKRADEGDKDAQTQLAEIIFKGKFGYDKKTDEERSVLLKELAKLGSKAADDWYHRAIWRSSLLDGATCWKDGADYIPKLERFKILRKLSSEGNEYAQTYMLEAFTNSSDLKKDLGLDDFQRNQEERRYKILFEILKTLNEKK